MVIPGTTHLPFEYLLDGLYAYVMRDPQVKTREIVQESEQPKLALDERITELGSEVCRDDFVWVCCDLNEPIQEKYDGDSMWQIALRNRDNFFIPLMPTVVFDTSVLIPLILQASH